MLSQSSHTASCSKKNDIHCALWRLPISRPINSCLLTHKHMLASDSFCSKDFSLREGCLMEEGEEVLQRRGFSNINKQLQ